MKPVSINRAAIELLQGLDLELLDQQINSLCEIEAELKEDKRQDHISGLLNFLCPLYYQLGGKIDEPTLQ